MPPRAFPTVGAIPIVLEEVVCFNRKVNMFLEQEKLQYVSAKTVHHIDLLIRFSDTFYEKTMQVF